MELLAVNDSLVELFIDALNDSLGEIFIDPLLEAVCIA